MAEEQDAAQPGDGAPPEGMTPPEPAEMDEGSEADALAAAALRAAQEAVSAINTEASSAVSQPAAPRSAPGAAPLPFHSPDLSPTDASAMPKGLDLLSDVNVHVTIELGRTRMLVEDVLRLSEGSVVELDKLAGDPVDVYVNERLVARGEVLVLNDNFCVRVNEILDADKVEEN
ncbi:MAG: flagellar motor switch protein FliN [Phycisphaerales bacterium]